MKKVRMVGSDDSHTGDRQGNKLKMERLKQAEAAANPSEAPSFTAPTARKELSIVQS